ncbi:tetratricopeptide-like helical domain, DYW domain protein [Artemisia annua]|uniref:Tetratricopeptide-like helical domain, DYW domain protein n=1 Tax=Artemisia annua TaxID=35608 RepID=A0A2U1PZW3_ARTAN|nr:tetratricopeptide-like helical domain, DYW domain protein [Artemisia annua]
MNMQRAPAIETPLIRNRPHNPLEFRTFCEVAESFDPDCWRDVVMRNDMISVLGKHGFVEDARGLFDSMVVKDSYSWKLEFNGFMLLDFYAKVGDLSSAKRVDNEMPRKDVVANNAIITALSDVRSARFIFDSNPVKDSLMECKYAMIDGH